MKSIEQATAYYREILDKRHVESTRACLLETVSKHQLVLYDAPSCTALQPYLMDRSTYRRLCKTVELLARGLCVAIDRLAVDEPLRRTIGLPTYLDRLLEIDNNRRDHGIIGRFDGYMRDGHYSSFEFNTAVGGSITLIHESTAAFERMPIASEFASRYPYRTTPIYELAFDAVYEEHLRRGGEGPPSIGAFRFSPEVFAPPGFYFMRWLYHLGAQGCRLFAATEDELFLQDGRLYAGDSALDFLVFATPEELHGTLETVQPLLDAVRSDAVRLLDGVSRSILGAQKSTFEILSDATYEAMFEPEVAAALHDHVPWTRVLRDRKTTHGAEVVDLLRHVEDHRDQLVIKPSALFGGAGVTLGWCVDDETWRRAIREGVKGHHVVQQRVVGEQQRFPVLDGESYREAEHYLDVDVHVWNGRRAEACWVRICEEPLTNVSSNATAVPMWILDDQP